MPTIRPMYDEDGITIYHADCRDVLPTLEQCDLLLTDPPYGVEKHLPKTTYGRDVNRNHKGVAAPAWGYLDWDKSPPCEETIAMCRDAARAAIIWGGNYFSLPPSPCWLVWDKDNSTTDFADCELAWTNLQKAVRKFRWRWNGMLQEHGGRRKEQRVHPTQKPLPLMQWCLKLVPEAQSVVDPFMGSGTTLVAAKFFGLRAVGIEINLKHCEAAIERLRQGVFDFTRPGG